jgi:PAS domain S-box-containing protein
MKPINGIIIGAVPFEDSPIFLSSQSALPKSDSLSSRSLQIIYNISRTILENANSSTLLADCLDIIQYDTKCTSVSVWFLDEENRSMCPVACSGDPLLTPHITSPDPLESWKNRDLELLRIPLPSSLNKRGILAALARREDAESILHVLHSTKPLLTAILERTDVRLTSRVDEQAIQVALEVAQEVTWDWNIASSKLTINAQWASHLGFDFEDSATIERLAKRLLHPDDLANCMTLLRAHLKGKSDIYTVTHRILDKSGRWQWFIVQGRVYERDSNGRALRMAGVHRNIDQERQAEEALKSSEERLRTALTASKSEIWEINLKTSDCRYDDRARALLGYTADEIPNDTTRWFGLIHPEDKPYILQSFIDHVQGKTEVYRVEARYRTKSGAWKWMANIGRVIEWDADGHPVRMAGTYTDIDDLKRSQLKLAASEAKYRLLAEYSSDVIFMLLPDSTIKYVSPSCQAILGYEPHDMIGHLGLGFLEGDSVDQASQLLADIANHPGSTTRELRFRRKDSTPIWIEVNARSILCPESGQVKEIVGAIRDITERKQREVELLRTREAADSANRAKSDFLAAMSHELRSPLHGVIGMVELLSTTRLTQQQTGFVQSASKAAQLLLSSINDILDFTKIEAGKLELDFAPFSIAEMISDVNLLFHESAKAKGLNLSVVTDPELSLEVLGDEIRIRQAIVNIVSNAIKFTFHGTVRLSAKVISRNSDTLNVRFEVTDSGIGISENAKSQLFSPFMQADRSTSRNFGGSGLGLAISKRLIDIMGGVIDYESTIGVGTRFWIDLPLITSDDDISNTVANGCLSTPLNVIDTLKAGDSIMKHNDIHILIVEDNEIGAEVAVELLKPYGFEITLADNGAFAIELFRDNQFDLILMDCQLPILDGYKTTRIIRSIEEERRSRGSNIPPVPVIALTASALRGDEERCLAAGMSDYLTKPLNSHLLHGAINRHLNERRELQRSQIDTHSIPHQSMNGPADLAWAIERFNSDSDFVVSLARNYLLGEVPIREKIAECIDRVDYDGLAFQVHSLGGLVSVFGAKGLSNLCGMIEAEAAAKMETCFRTASLTLLKLLDSLHDQLQTFVEQSCEDKIDPDHS